MKNPDRELKIPTMDDLYEKAKHKTLLGGTYKPSPKEISQMFHEWTQHQADYKKPKSTITRSN